MTNDIPTAAVDDLLSARQLADALHVTSATVRRWVRSGHLQPTRITYGGYYEFDLDDARRQLEAMRYVRKHPTAAHPDPRTTPVSTKTEAIPVIPVTFSDQP